MYRPGQGYVPGGGASQQAEPENQPAQPPQQRPLGSLQRRLQRSQASVPGGDQDDDIWGADEPPARYGERGRRSRPLDGQNDRYGSRRPSGGNDGYGDRGRRSRPNDEPPARRGSRGGGRSRDDYDDYGSGDESREEQAYSPYPAFQPDSDDSREYSAWDESREVSAYEPPRRHSGPERRRPIEDSAEMSAEGPAYEPPRRSAPRGRSRPVDSQRSDWDEYTDPLDDPRSPLRGSQGKRPSQGASGRGRRSSGGYPPASDQRSQRRPPGDYAGYTEGEMDARRYPDYGDGYDDYGSSGRAGAGASGRGPRGWGGAHPDPYERDDDDYASREGWAAPSGHNAPYAPESYGQGRREVGFSANADVWQPGGAADHPPGRLGVGAPQSLSRRPGDAVSGAKPAKKRKGGALRMVFSLLTTLALVAVVGVEFGPKLYHLVLTRGLGGSSTQVVVTCATEATPSAQIKPAAGSAAFATTAYTLTYPSGWQRNTKSGTSQNQCDVVYSFAQPNGAATFNVEQAGAFAPLTDQQVIQAEAQSAQQQGSTLNEITSAATTQSIGGEVWQRREYQATTKNGLKLHLALLAGHHKGAGYAIVLVSSDTGFSRDDTTTFEPMLHSFQFV